MVELGLVKLTGLKSPPNKFEMGPIDFLYKQLINGALVWWDVVFVLCYKKR